VGTVAPRCPVERSSTVVAAHLEQPLLPSDNGPHVAACSRLHSTRLLAILHPDTRDCDPKRNHSFSGTVLAERRWD